MSNFRKYTNKLIDAMDEGLIDPKTVAETALLYFSEDDIKAMCLVNDILFEEEEDEEE